MLYVEVKIKYKDGSIETFDCSDTPTINNDWTGIFPLKDPVSRRYIRTEKIEEVSYRYASKRK